MSTREKAISPTTQPSTKGASTATSRRPTAPNTYAYLPSTTRMKEPETPGRIMAQMASEPARNTNHAASGVFTGTRLTTAKPISAPDSSQPNSPARTPPMSLSSTITEAAMRPKKRL